MSFFTVNLQLYASLERKLAFGPGLLFERLPLGLAVSLVAHHTRRVSVGVGRAGGAAAARCLDLVLVWALARANARLAL